jgi:hypothetical protein
LRQKPISIIDYDKAPLFAIFSTAMKERVPDIITERYARPRLPRKAYLLTRQDAAQREQLQHAFAPRPINGAPAMSNLSAT